MGGGLISFVPGYYGHLGNQMFQYAATFALARYHGTECVWPVGKQPELHNLLTLRAFKVQHPADRTVYRYREKHFHFDPEFWKQPDGTELSGYFQSEKYFDGYEDQIRREFVFMAADVEPPEFNMETCCFDGWVSVHVRRGDYLSFPDHHPPLTVEYYREAMGRFPDKRFMVFSDDPGWCLLNLKPLAETVNIITGNPAHEDMRRMSLCESHIIANSSFSWWGAWLDPNPDKKVIAPGEKFPWFGPAKAGWDTKDLIPEGWVRL